MSAYMEFFIRADKNKYITVGSYSRNTAVYDICNINDCPYDSGIKALKYDDLMCFYRRAEDEIQKLQKDKARLDDELDFLMNCNDSFNDKLDAYHERIEIKNDIDDLIESYRFAQHFFIIMTHIVTDTYEDMLYYGIEVSNLLDDAIIK